MVIATICESHKTFSNCIQVPNIVPGSAPRRMPMVPFEMGKNWQQSSRLPATVRAIPTVPIATSKSFISQETNSLRPPIAYGGKAPVSTKTLVTSYNDRFIIDPINKTGERCKFFPSKNSPKAVHFDHDATRTSSMMSHATFIVENNRRRPLLALGGLSRSYFYLTDYFCIKNLFSCKY